MDVFCEFWKVIVLMIIVDVLLKFETSEVWPVLKQFSHVEH